MAGPQLKRPPWGTDKGFLDVASPSLSAAESDRLPAWTGMAARRALAIPRLEDATARGVTVSEAAAEDVARGRGLCSALLSRLCVYQRLNRRAPESVQAVEVPSPAADAIFRRAWE